MELKPCPFCGGQAEFRTKKVKNRISKKQLPGQQIALYYLRCKKCRAKTNLFHDKNIVIREWNIEKIFEHGFIREIKKT